MSRQEACLHQGDQAERQRLREVAGLPLPLLALLVSAYDGLARRIGNADGAARTLLEVGGAELPAIDEGEGDAIGDQRPKLLHQIEGQSRPARPQPVEEADLRVES